MQYAAVILENTRVEKSRLLEKFLFNNYDPTQFSNTHVKAPLDPSGNLRIASKSVH